MQPPRDGCARGSGGHPRTSEGVPPPPPRPRPPSRRPPLRNIVWAPSAAAAVAGHVRTCRRSHRACAAVTAAAVALQPVGPRASGGRRGTGARGRLQQVRPPRARWGSAAAASATPAPAVTAAAATLQLSVARGWGVGRSIAELLWAAFLSAAAAAVLVPCSSAPVSYAGEPEARGAATRFVRPGARSIGLRPPLPRPSLVQPPRVGLLLLRPWRGLWRRDWWARARGRLAAPALLSERGVGEQLPFWLCLRSRCNVEPLWRCSQGKFSMQVCVRDFHLDVS